MMEPEKAYVIIAGAADNITIMAVSLDKQFAEEWIEKEKQRAGNDGLIEYGLLFIRADTLRIVETVFV